MAYIDSVDVGDAEVMALATREDGLSFVNVIVWRAYELVKDKKFPGILGILGKKVSSIRWVIVLLVGEPLHA